ncbi:hypothetical protein NDU88_001035 [Pleurodeles waltl]|uniref:Uncharacterized protein n=1 Tax=Pleurodeles waltl TaxID=8319 RepID=A0AAV7Q5V5_PLEWA|nr:hypothetical protein NDU88_001035 [Pleurodeles waltl]
MGKTDKNKAILQFDQRKSQNSAGDRAVAGVVLVNLLCPNREKDTIMVVQAEDGSEITDPKHIANRFCMYYEALYTSKIAPNQEEALDYLLHIELPGLTAADIESFMAPLSLGEMSRAQEGMAEGTPPGPVGLTVRFYKGFKDILFPHLRAVYAEMAEAGVMPPSMREAMLIALLKPGKLPTQCSPYSPFD